MATDPATSSSTGRRTGPAWLRSATRTSASTGARDARCSTRSTSTTGTPCPASGQEQRRRQMSARTTQAGGPGRSAGRRAALRDGADQRGRPVRQRRHGLSRAGVQASAGAERRRAGHRREQPGRPPVDVVFDGQRVWTFWVRRDTEPARAGTSTGAVAGRRCAGTSTGAPGSSSATRRRRVLLRRGGLASATARSGSGSSTNGACSSGSTSRESWCRRSRRAAAVTSPHSWRHPVGARRAGVSRRRSRSSATAPCSALSARAPCSATTPTQTSAT